MGAATDRKAAWWGTKTRQFRSHLRARVSATERASLAAWLDDRQLALFDSMHVADRRHGLDVVARLREAGVDDRDVLLAGLLHDCGKGHTGVVPRIVYSLGQAYGRWIPRSVSRLPGLRRALHRLEHHAIASASLAARAGCSDRTVDLIRHQDEPRDVEYGEMLRLADEAS